MEIEFNRTTTLPGVWYDWKTLTLTINIRENIDSLTNVSFERSLLYGVSG